MTSHAKRFGKIFVAANADVVPMRRGIHVGEVTWLARVVFVEAFLAGSCIRALRGVGPLIDWDRIGLWCNLSCAGRRRADNRWFNSALLSSEAEVAEFIDLVQNETIPKLRAVRTFEDYLSFKVDDTSGSPRDSSGEFEGFLLAGDFETAVVKLDERLTPVWPMSKKSHREQDAAMRRDEGHLRSLLVARDAPAIAELLRKREVETIANLGLTKHWQKRPYPFEERFGLV
jgi:hypothetical protein